MSLAWPANSAEAFDAAPRPLRPVRVAVAGLEGPGIDHLAALAMVPDCTLAAVIETDARLVAAARGLGFHVPRFADVRALLEKEKLDALVVAASPDEHLEIAGPALSAGVPVLLNRPLAHTLADAEALVSAAASAHVPLACGHALAYEPVFAAAHYAVRGGALGTIRQARSSMYVSEVFAPRKGWRYDPARSGGGVVANASIDLLFMLDRALGPVVECHATWNKLFGDAEDELHGMMKVANGVEVGFDCSWSVPGYRRSAVVVEVEGTNGRLLVSDDALELEIAQGMGGWPGGTTRKRRGEFPQPARFDYQGEALYLQNASFLAWVTGGPEPPSAGAASLRAHRVMDALYRSAAKGGSPVEVTT